MISVLNLLKNGVKIISTADDIMRLSFNDKKYNLQLKPKIILHPFDDELAKILEIEKDIPENYTKLYKNESQLSWTGSFGVGKFNTCARLAYLSSKKISKEFGDNAKVSVAMGSLIHKYALCDFYNPSDLISEYTSLSRYAFPELIDYDVKDIVDRTRDKINEKISEALDYEYTIRYEEKYIYKIKNIPLVQYVDCYALKKTNDNQLYVIIIDLKTSRRNETDVLTYWEQLLYYEYNLTQKLSTEFNIPKENIHFEKAIIWAIIKKTTKPKNRVLKTYSQDLLEKNILSTPLKQEPFKTSLTISTYALRGFTIYTYCEEKKIISEILLNSISDQSSLIKKDDIITTKEHYDFMEKSINNAINIIEKNDISPNYRACNKNKYGCDYESICHLKTRMCNKEETKETIKSKFENFDTEIINKVLNENIF